MRIKYTQRLSHALLFVMSWLLSASLLHAEVNASLQFAPYYAHHSMPQTLKQALDAASTVRKKGAIFYGHTNWRVDWTFSTLALSNGACKLADIKVNLKGIMVLPVLASKDANTIIKFNKFLVALKNHEYGHYSHGQQAANKINSKFNEYSVMAGCDIAVTEANRMANEIVQQYINESNRYDVNTQHGRTEGAWLE
jgi:predicted secreted Zn-dependent protease